MPHTLDDIRIAVIGLGYVGLPLAVEFGKVFPTIGFDIKAKRIEELSQGRDHTLEVSSEELAASAKLQFSHALEDLRSANVYIVTVPTPIDKNKQPDLSPLRFASEAIGSILKENDIVIYESTVFPGATEEFCIPILEQASGLTYNKDFYAGYSPERVNPGDKVHRINQIVKVTSGSTPEVADLVDKLYASIITAGTHRASSIAVAEAAKVIENTQRDVNIALVNELSLLFNQLNLNTNEVLQAAGTKWNFLPFKPGLVGGHCIGVDPYYLTHKAMSIGYHPRIILSGREVNDGMGAFVAESVIKLMTRKRIQVVDSTILILGFTFKENCPDVRNTRVIDIIDEFNTYHARVQVYDPWVDVEEAKQEYDVEFITKPKHGHYDAIVVAVPHREFMEMDIGNISKLGKSPCVIYDVKSIFAKDKVDGQL